MDYFSILEKCSRQNITMVLLLLFTEAGTGPLLNKKVIMSCLFHSRMESRRGTMRFLQTDLRVQIISWELPKQNIVPADWPKGRMELCMLQMMPEGRFGEL